MKSYKLIIAVLSAILNINLIYAQDYITMKKEQSGVYTVPCEVNGLRLRFVFDTGASSVSLSLTEATFMLKNGYIDESDITGTTNIQTADGKIAENYTVNLRELKIGSETLTNVKAVVSTGLDAPLLLGQSVLDRLGHWTFKNGTLILNEVSSDQTFSSFNELMKYCQTQLINRNPDKALDALMAYEDGQNIYAMQQFIRKWRTSYGHQEYLNYCISYLENYDYQSLEDKANAYMAIAQFNEIALNNIRKAEEIYAKIARDTSVPKCCRSNAYEGLFLMFYKSLLDKAMNYAKEGIDNGMYELASWYCPRIIEQGRKQEAFQIYMKGYALKEDRCTFGLGNGYIEGTWTEKNVQKGVAILDELANRTQYPDAVYVLCDFYMERENYDKVIRYAGLFVDEPSTRNMFEGIAYMKKKMYQLALYRFNHVDIKYGAMFMRMDLRAEYYANLGKIYEEGLGVTPDLNKAFDYYTGLAGEDAGWGNACLGALFVSPLLEHKDYKRAYSYFIIGANNDNIYCCYQLALLHKYGLGTYQSDAMFKLYKDKAISLGADPSEFSF